MGFNWSCPHCGQPVTMNDDDIEHASSIFQIGTATDDEIIGVQWKAYKCPNPQCHKFTLDLAAGFGKIVQDPLGNRRKLVKFAGDKAALPIGVGSFRFSPRGGAPLSSHVPMVVANDYTEACLIKDLSSKAAATLCRRALQGMVRDFWNVVKPTLHEELNAIKAKCDQGLFDALMGIKSIGNIGAHPEKDINLIIDVEPGEVEALIEVLHVLDAEWYVDRADRAARLAKVNHLSQKKAAAKQTTAVALPVPPSVP